ncbi:MAG: Na/Pi cotransporter family protein [Spirochaetaceae bacterium]|jgi:phosphate:Na+ symporter|nr:Na/Pi cotransporter family protein [Spirochaetaceae bacterium]
MPDIVTKLFSLGGGLCLFLFGVKTLSEGVQAVAGERLQKALNFMTGNRFVGVLTGAVVTTMVQSSSAVTVMLVSFVNAGLLTLQQAVGVIFGSNIGTTTTAWVVSLIGFKFNIAAFALPALAAGFIIGNIRWKHRELGSVFIGFSFVFLGLQFMTEGLPTVSAEQVSVIARFSDLGFLSLLIGLGVGTLVTLLMHSSAATITLVITLAYGGVLNYDISASMILGANIGTTIDAILAAIGGKPAAKQTALVHVLFNVVGSIIVLLLFRPFIFVVDLLIPGPLTHANLPMQLAMFHSIFNIFCTLIFLPFVGQIAALAKIIIKDKDGASDTAKKYVFEYSSGGLSDSPELNVVRAEKEIRDMAGIVSSMYADVSGRLSAVYARIEKDGRDKALERCNEMNTEMQEKEDYADQMREQLTMFLIECAKRGQLNRKYEQKVGKLIRIVADLEEMTDMCCGVGYLLARGIRKDQLPDAEEIQALAPYLKDVENFLAFVQNHLGRPVSRDEERYAQQLEDGINKTRNKLRKRGRKQIEGGANVKAELLFIDLVRRIEGIGDYCYSIAEKM